MSPPTLRVAALGAAGAAAVLLALRWRRGRGGKRVLIGVSKGWFEDDLRAVEAALAPHSYHATLLDTEAMPSQPIGLEQAANAALEKMSQLRKLAAAQAERDSRTSYSLPDGQSVTLSAERFRAPDVLFDPTLVGSEEPGAADVLVDSIMKSDIDLRSTLFSQVVLAGGSTMFPGFGDRMLHEVRSRSPVHTKIRISAPPERMNSTFVGGSILASLATFKSMWVSRAEFEEHGTSILHRDKL